MNINDIQIPSLNIPLLNNMLQRVQHAPLVEEQNDTIQNKLNIEFGSTLQNQPELIAKFDKISVSLFKMGIPPRLVINSFFAFKYKSIEEALEILEKDSEGLWIHKYIESDDNNCFVCAEKEEKHRTLNLVLEKKNSYNIPNQELKKKLSQKDSKKIQLVDISIGRNEDVIKINLKNCPICWAELEDGNKLLLKCNHEYCKTCIVEYINEEIKNARVQEIKCPTVECKEVFTEDFIKSLINEDYFYKYKKFLNREKLKDNPNFIPCPIVNCEGYADISNTNANPNSKLINKDKPQEFDNNKANLIKLEVNNNDNNYNINLDNESQFNRNNVQGHNRTESQIDFNNKDENKTKVNIKLTCTNNHNFCSNCNQAWHYETSCQEDKEVKQFATESGFILKKCPKCKVWTEKSEGCNHMTCKLCKFDWCWLCELDCLPTHYTQRFSMLWETIQRYGC